LERSKRTAPRLQVFFGLASCLTGWCGFTLTLIGVWPAGVPMMILGFGGALWIGRTMPDDVDTTEQWMAMASGAGAWPNHSN